MVGMPTPRLMNSLPFWASLSKWRAITDAIRSFACCSSIACISALPHRQHIHIYVGCHYALRVQGPHRDYLFDFGYDGVCRHRHDRIEVAGSLVVDQIAQLVGLVGLDECHVGMDGFFQDTRLPGEFSGLLACREFCPRSSRCEDCLLYTSPSPR